MQIDMAILKGLTDDLDKAKMDVLRIKWELETQWENISSDRKEDLYNYLDDYEESVGGPLDPLEDPDNTNDYFIDELIVRMDVVL